MGCLFQLSTPKFCTHCSSCSCMQHAPIVPYERRDSLQQALIAIRRHPLLGLIAWALKVPYKCNLRVNLNTHTIRSSTTIPDIVYPPPRLCSSKVRNHLPPLKAASLHCPVIRLPTGEHTIEYFHGFSSFLASEEWDISLK